MNRRALIVLSCLVGCGDEADGGLSDVSIPDGEVAADSAGDASADSADSAADTAPADIDDTADDTGADSADDTSPADTAVDTAADTADTTADGEVGPACVSDEQCAGTAIVPPNACLVPRCIEGACIMAEPDCADTDPCTDDFCDPRAGCAHFAPTLDVGASRFTLCREAMTQADAVAGCVGRGEQLAEITDPAIADALRELVDDGGSAWVGSLSNVTCAVPKRIVPLLCVLYQDLGDGACTEISDCQVAWPFLCEARCNDLDPCTDDIMDADGACVTKPSTCDDGDACTIDSCFPDVGCVNDHPRGQCVDSNPCTTDTCDPASGQCSNKPVRAAWDVTHELLQCPGADTWPAAENWCAVNGGVLAYPTTDAQRSTLDAFAASPGVSTSIWTALEQPGGGAVAWQWSAPGLTGDPPWCTGEPNDANGSEDCGEWRSVDHCTADSLCDQPHSFACSIDISIP